MVDLGFIIDASGSIGQGNWNKMMRFLMSLTSKLNVNGTQTRVGALTFASDAKVEFCFNELQDTDAVNDKFAEMIWRRGSTNTDEGLKLAVNSLFRYHCGMRADAAKVSKIA